MRILFFSHYFPPEPGAPAVRVYEHAKFWVKLGHEVTVVTGFPNHPTGTIPKQYKGKIYEKEVIDGITVIRTWTLASANIGFGKRSISFISSLITSVLFALNPIIKADVVVGTSPQLLTPLAAYIISRIKRKPFVLEVRDLWPEVIVELGLVKEGKIIKLLRKLALFLYRKADKIIVVSESFRNYLIQLNVPAQKIFIIPNGVDPSLFRQIWDQHLIREKLGVKDKFLVMYCGNHGMAQGLEVIIEAAKLLREKEEVYFYLVGDGPEKEQLKMLTGKYQLKNVGFMSSQPRSEIISYYHAANVCLVPLKKSKLLEKFIPSKLFEIMACKKTVLASLHGEAAKIIKDANCGLVVPPGDAAVLAKSILFLTNHPELLRKFGQAGRVFVERYYNRENLAQDYLGILDKIIYN